MTGRLGSRGGTTATLEEGQARLEESLQDDSERIRSAILRSAFVRGEFHADQAAEWPIRQANQIGAQVNALARMGLLEKLNRDGELEHRKAKAKASHGRASYVWRLTAKGRKAAEAALERRRLGHPEGIR
jgi:predicted ArsR family transcriptional regulator